MRQIGIILIGITLAAPPAFADAARDCASNNHDIAIRACTQLIQRNPRNAVYYFNRALSYRATGRVDAALADYNRAVAVNPRYHEAFNNRGTIYISRGENERALMDFIRATEINPRYALAHNNRGEALENLRRYQEALDAYSRAIDINPKYARAYANRGDVWRKMGRREDAAADYRHALSIDENNRLAHDGLKILGRTTSSTGPATRPPPSQPQQPPAQASSPPQTQHAAAPPTQPAPTPPRQASVSTGTGFFVSSQGHILTNHHVVEKCSRYSVSHEGALSESARVVSSDSKNDLALLRTTGLKPGAVPNIRLGVRLGENIYIYGFPLSGMLASSGNFTIGNVTAVAGLGDDTTMIQMSAPVQPGNSGGPVLDQHGNVVAVVVSKLNALRVAKLTSDIPQNVNFAIKSLIAMSFLEAANVSAAVQSATEKLDATQVAERARTFTVQIRCS